MFRTYCDKCFFGTQNKEWARCHSQTLQYSAVPESKLILPEDGGWVTKIVGISPGALMFTGQKYMNMLMIFLVIW